MPGLPSVVVVQLACQAWVQLQVKSLCRVRAVRRSITGSFVHCVRQNYEFCLHLLQQQPQQQQPQKAMRRESENRMKLNWLAACACACCLRFCVCVCLRMSPPLLVFRAGQANHHHHHYSQHHSHNHQTTITTARKKEHNNVA